MFLWLSAGPQLYVSYAALVYSPLDFPVPRYLDLLNIVDDEHVLQVLHSSLHPVVERCRSLGVLQVQLIYRLQLLLCPLLAGKQKTALLKYISIHFKIHLTFHCVK